MRAERAAGRGEAPGSREGERCGEMGERVRRGVEALVLVEPSSCGLMFGVVFAIRQTLLGSWRVLFPRIFLLLILTPLQALLFQSQETDRASWVMLRLDGFEQDVCLQPPKQWVLPPLSVFFRLYSVSFFFFFPSVKIMALGDMTSGIDLKDEN